MRYWGGTLSKQLLSSVDKLFRIMVNHSGSTVISIPALFSLVKNTVAFIEGVVLGLIAVRENRTAIVTIVAASRLVWKRRLASSGTRIEAQQKGRERSVHVKTWKDQGHVKWAVYVAITRLLAAVALVAMMGEGIGTLSGNKSTPFLKRC